MLDNIIHSQRLLLDINFLLRSRSSRAIVGYGLILLLENTDARRIVSRQKSEHDKRIFEYTFNENVQREFISEYQISDFHFAQRRSLLNANNLENA